MRVILALHIVLLALCAYSQQQVDDTLSSEKKFRFHGRLGGGLNWENNPYQEAMSYGIHLAENDIKFGYFWTFGADIRYKKRYGIGLQVVNRVTQRNKNAFNNSLAELFPDKEVLLRSNLSSVSRFGIRLSLSYQLKLKSFYFTPNVYASATFGAQGSYEYVLRTPSTNYFDHYRVYNRSKGEYPLSLGFNLSHAKLKWLELVAEAGMSTCRNKYQVYDLEIGDKYGQDPDEEFEFSRKRYYFSIGLIISADFN